MAAHHFPEGAERCRDCGTLQANVNQTACPGPKPGVGGEKLRPEPARHQYASEDFDTIGTRTAELYAERTAAMNEPPKDDAT